MPEAVQQYMRKLGTEVVNRTSEGILGISTLSVESAALMRVNAGTLSDVADVAANYSLPALSVAQTTLMSTTMDKYVGIVKRLQESAYKSRVLAMHEDSQCVDTAFELRNITVKIEEAQLLLSVAFASNQPGSPEIRDEMVHKVCELLHDISDWAVRPDGTYSKEQQHSLQRQQLSKELQSITLEIKGLLPVLPKVASQHQSNAAYKQLEAEQLRQRADDAWLRSTQHISQTEALQAATAAQVQEDAHRQLIAAYASLVEIIRQITNGAVGTHMQLLNAKHHESLIARERLLTVLRMAKSVSVNPALAKYLAEFLADMHRAIDNAAIKAAGICIGTLELA